MMDRTLGKGLLLSVSAGALALIMPTCVQASRTVPLPQQYCPCLACTREVDPEGGDLPWPLAGGGPRSPVLPPLSSPPSHESLHREPSNPLPIDSAPLQYPYHLPFLSPPLSEGPGSSTSPHHHARGLSWHSQCSGPIAPKV